MNDSLAFIDPVSGLIYGGLALLVTAVFVRGILIKRERALRLGLQYKFSPTQCLIPLILFIIAFALGRPYLGYNDIVIDRPVRDIYVIADVSKSMLVGDINPSRSEIAKRKIKDIVRILEKSDEPARVAIVVFSAESYLFTPPTSDFPTVDLFADSVSPSLMTSEGSDITAAITTAVESAKRSESTEPNFLLLTDGEDPDLRPAQVHAQISAIHGHLYALGLGTPEGKPIEDGPRGYVKDVDGNIVISRLNEKALSELAAANDGVYMRARVDPSDIAFVIRRILEPGAKQSAKNASPEKLRSYNEIGPAALAVAVGIVILGILLRTPQLLFMLCLVWATPGYGADEPEKSPAPTGSLHDGYSAYSKGDYKTAKNIFERYAKSAPEDPKVLQALASSYFKLGDYKNAQKVYSDELEHATTGREKFDSYYNRGNTWLQKKEYQRAIDDYDHALKIKDKDVEATHNREVAKKLLIQQQKKESEKNRDKKNQEQSQNQKSSNDQKNQGDKKDSNNQKSDDEKNDKNDQSKPGSGVTSV